jgi:hypothetical protein
MADNSSNSMMGTLREFTDQGGMDLIGTVYLAKGKKYFVDGLNGSDSLPGDRPDRPMLTLAAAFARCVAGQNDVIYIIGNGQASGSIRLSANFAWNKNATHLIGITAPTRVSQRARIAPTSGATAFANMFTVSGFGTGTSNQICWTDTGERNYYNNVAFQGMGDQTSADSAGSRSLKIGSGGNGEHTFVNCTIGLDTITRGAANASIEFAGATPRNSFFNCILPFQTDASSPLGIIGTGAGCMDRWQLFKDCMFMNNVGSGTTTMAALATIPASPGGFILIKDCTRVDITDLGTNANSLAAIYVDGAPLPVGDDAGKAVVAIAT